MVGTPEEPVQLSLTVRMEGGHYTFVEAHTSAQGESRLDRNVKTRLLIRDGQTVVLGGLSDRQRDHSQGGVPFLSLIPWLGGLFGRVSDQMTETELLLFIRPTVLKTDDEADAATAPRLKKAAVEP